MNEKCKKCGNNADGEFYTFHHGRKTFELDQKYGRKGQVQIKTTAYSFIDAVSYYLCNDCISRRIKRNLLIGLIGGIVFALLSMFFWRTKIDISFLPGMVTLCLGIILLYGFPLVSLLLFVSGFLALRRKITGEGLAIEIGQQEIKTSDTFWNNEDYEKLTKL
jgi:hypothetical protein